MLHLLSNFLKKWNNIKYKIFFNKKENIHYLFSVYLFITDNPRVKEILYH